MNNVQVETFFFSLVAARSGAALTPLPKQGSCAGSGLRALPPARPRPRDMTERKKTVAPISKRRHRHFGQGRCQRQRRELSGVSPRRPASVAAWWQRAFIISDTLAACRAPAAGARCRLQHRAAPAGSRLDGELWTLGPFANL